ncbi:hypothetical protein [Streptomyces rubrogriseus]|nr:hypothetical protein [Streptomyces sp. SID5926]
MSDFDVGQRKQGANGRGCVTRVHAGVGVVLQATETATANTDDAVRRV